MDDITSVIKDELSKENPNVKNVLILVLETLHIMTTRITELENKMNSFDGTVSKLSNAHTRYGGGQSNGPTIG